MRIKKFLLFTAPAAGERKNFAGSHETRDEAIQAAGRLKDGGGLWWQVIETATAECVAEDPGRTRTEAVTHSVQKRAQDAPKPAARIKGSVTDADA